MLNKSQQHAATCNRVWKRTQHVTCDNVGSCTLNVTNNKNDLVFSKTVGLRSFHPSLSIRASFCICKVIYTFLKCLSRYFYVSLILVSVPTIRILINFVTDLL